MTKIVIDGIIVTSITIAMTHPQHHLLSAAGKGQGVEAEEEWIPKCQYLRCRKGENLKWNPDQRRSSYLQSARDLMDSDLMTTLEIHRAQSPPSSEHQVIYYIVC